MAKRTRGLSLVIAGALMPVIGYAVKLAYINSVSQVPPDQGKLVEGSGIFALCIWAGGVVALFGVVTLYRSSLTPAAPASETWQAVRRTACVGAFIANAVVVAACFTAAAIFGATEPNFGAPLNLPTFYGLKAGLIVLEVLLYVSIVTFGIPPLVVSAIGAVIALVARWIVLKRRAAKQSGPASARQG